MGVGDWVRTFPRGLWLPPEEGAQAQAAFVRRALRLRKGSRVLDAPCGAGRIAVHLARAGCVVTGVDRSAAFIARARRRFRAEGLAGRFVAGDLREMDFDGEFDAAFNWGGSFGYFSDAENADIVRRYARALRGRGGRLLIDTPSREYVLRHFHGSQTRGRVSTESRWQSTSQRVESTWTVRPSTSPGAESASRRAEARRSFSSIRLYTPGQFRALLEDAVLTPDAFLGDLDGGPLRRSSRRIYVVGRKP